MPGALAYYKYDPSRLVPEKSDLCLCPRCGNNNFIDRVMAVLQNMPPEGYRDMYDRMLVPLLRSFSEFNPAMFPLAWVMVRPVEIMPTHPMRRLFHHMCACLHGHKDIEGDMVEDVVQSIHVWGEDLVSWLMRKRRKGGRDGAIERDRLIRISASLHELGGVDVVYRRVYLHVSGLIRCAQMAGSPYELCAYGFCVGRPHHMLAVAQRFHSWYEKRRNPTSRSRLAILSYLGLLIELVQARLCRQADKNLAVAMALHSRLGVNAEISCLGADMLPLCLPKPVQSVVNWRDAMGRWIREDCDMSDLSS